MFQSRWISRCLNCGFVAECLDLDGNETNAHAQRYCHGHEESHVHRGLPISYDRKRATIETSREMAAMAMAIHD
jgi:hypothetical protein